MKQQMQIVLAAVLVVIAYNSIAEAKPACTSEYEKGLKAFGAEAPINTAVADDKVAKRLVTDYRLRNKALRAAYDQNEGRDSKAEVERLDAEVKASTWAGWPAALISRKVAAVKHNWSKGSAVKAAAAKDEDMAFDAKQLSYLQSPHEGYWEKRENEIGDKGIDRILESKNGIRAPINFGYVKGNQLIGYKIRNGEWAAVVKLDSACAPSAVKFTKGESTVTLTPQLCQSTKALQAHAATTDESVDPIKSCEQQGGVMKKEMGGLFGSKPACHCPGAGLLANRPQKSCFEKAVQTAEDKILTVAAKTGGEVKANRADVESAVAGCEAFKSILGTDTVREATINENKRIK